MGPDGESGSGLLYLMYVAPEHWRTGTGGLLMEASLARMKHDGYRMAVLWVLDENERARRFYERYGWATDGVSQPNDYGGTRLNALRYAIAL